MRTNDKTTENLFRENHLRELAAISALLDDNSEIADELAHLLLHAETPGERIDAAKQIADYGPAAARAPIPEALSLAFVREDDRSVQAALWEALGALGTDAALAQPGLIQRAVTRLKSPAFSTPALGSVAARALCRIDLRRVPADDFEAALAFLRDAAGQTRASDETREWASAALSLFASPTPIGATRASSILHGLWERIAASRARPTGARAAGAAQRRPIDSAGWTALADEDGAPIDDLLGRRFVGAAGVAWLTIVSRETRTRVLRLRVRASRDGVERDVLAIAPGDTRLSADEGIVGVSRLEPDTLTADDVASLIVPALTEWSGRDDTSGRNAKDALARWLADAPEAIGNAVESAG